MSQHKPSFEDELRQYNARLDYQLRSQFGMSIKLFKTIKALTQLVGAAAGVFAMHLGADPMSAFALIAFIISGPEALEYIINANNPQEDG